MTSASDEYVIVGEITGVHGVKGWVKVRSFTEPRENLLSYQTWYLHHDQNWQVSKLIDGRKQGKGLIAFMEGVDDRDAALKFRGNKIAVLRSQLPQTEEHEYYWTDLIGLEVRTTKEVVLGQIKEMMATGANDVMVVEDAERQRLIPFVQEQVVLEVDLANAVMTVDWDPDF